VDVVAEEEEEEEEEEGKEEDDNGDDDDGDEMCWEKKVVGSEILELTKLLICWRDMRGWTRDCG
jgi:hypothetical protein